MATAPALMTIEQYLHTSYRPDVDFIDGQIEERHLGEFDHGHLQGLFFAWFLQRMPQTRLVPVTELRVRVAPSRVRICDIGVVRQDTPREQVAVTPPAVCIEVLSPEDRLKRAENVLSDYLAMGVENIWLIDPVRRAAYIFDSKGLRHAPNNVLPIRGASLSVEADELFTALDNLNA
jgi:Uma2 family endonuclease